MWMWPFKNYATLLFENLVPLARPCPGNSIANVFAEAITGTLIVLWKMARCLFYVLFSQRGNEEALQSDTLTQPVRHIDCNISPARHTDWYARSTTKVPCQIHRNRPGQRSRCCCTEATIHFQSVPLPAAGLKEPEKAPPWLKRVATTGMTKLFVMLSLTRRRASQFVYLL